MSNNANRPSFFRNVLDSMVEARARQASRYVNGALMMLDDEALKARGFKRSDLTNDKWMRNVK